MSSIISFGEWHGEAQVLALHGMLTAFGAVSRNKPPPPPGTPEAILQHYGHVLASELFIRLRNAEEDELPTRVLLIPTAHGELCLTASRDKDEEPCICVYMPTDERWFEDYLTDGIHYTSLV